MSPDDVRMIAGIAASLVAAIGVVGLAFLGAYLITTDHRRLEEPKGRCGKNIRDRP